MLQRHNGTSLKSMLPAKPYEKKNIHSFREFYKSMLIAAINANRAISADYGKISADPSFFTQFLIFFDDAWEPLKTMAGIKVYC